MESAGSQQVEPFFSFVFHLMETASAIPEGTRGNTECFLSVVNSKVQDRGHCPIGSKTNNAARSSL